MYALNGDFSASDTTPATSSQRSRNFIPRRELEFQLALDNYLSDYRLSMDASKCRAGTAPRSIIRKFVEWYRRQVVINYENTSYLYNYGRQWRNDGHKFSAPNSPVLNRICQEMSANGPQQTF